MYLLHTQHKDTCCPLAYFNWVYDCMCNNGPTKQRGRLPLIPWHRVLYGNALLIVGTYA